MNIKITNTEAYIEKDILKFFYISGEGNLYSEKWTQTIPSLKDLKTGEDEPSARFWADSNTVVFNAKSYKRYGKHEGLKTALYDFVNIAESKKLGRACIVIDNTDSEEVLRDVLKGLMLGGYRYQKYVEKKNEVLEKLELEILINSKLDESSKEILQEEIIYCTGANLARDFVNQPANEMYPETLAQQAREIADKHGLEIEILDEKALEKNGYNGIMSVGKGSQFPPRMIIMKYRSPNAKSHIGLVGKGVTFDSGGLSLKPPKDMHEMKGDMGGAAAALGAMHIIGAIKPGVNVTAVIPAVENMIGSMSIRPGDIFKHKSGKYVQVDNTDAEGRLILIDGIHRAFEEGAEKIIDIATLTGACLKALGTSCAGILGNDESLIKDVIQSGKEVGEDFWNLPLIEEYRKNLDTPIADIKNVAGPNAGVITAALFIKEFVPEKTKWVHLDIAGPFYFEKGWKYYKGGATGFSTMTLAKMVYDTSRNN
ncbi:MAG: leucyl aminopeptidase [Spirochaetes bacterium]|nr:leucyl aminopeptidase [Spirochaetota bacterium]